MTAELVRYNAMLHAIAVCHSVDEVKDLKDKAHALELYARQSKNTDAERKACDIRMRAERRTGELLKELARSQTAGLKVGPLSNDGATEKSPYADALSRTGISRQTASRYQALAGVPAETFEAAMAGADKPTTSGVLEASRVVQEARDPSPKMPADALWLWGRMRDLEREGYFTKSPESLLSPLTETMLADMQRILPLCADFFNQLAEYIHEPA